MTRRKKSGGQAIVLVTLALLAMCGMMGLAVDMGWSFFVHKQAQAAADAAALGATQEAIKRISGNGVIVSAFTCASGGTGATQADCETTPVSCASVVATSNLNNGCQYAKQNGFDWTNPRQTVTIQSNDGAVANLPPTAPGVVNMVYWVTVRTVQTVPQLFSSILNRSEGTVSAVATAAIAASIGPGQFYGMDRKGDCLGWTGVAGKLVGGSNCGVDVTLSPGGGKQTQCGNFKANLCAPAGILLSSQCNTTSTGVCDSGAAADGGNNGVAMGSSLTIMGDGTAANDGKVTGSWNNMSGKALSPLYTMDTNTFRDPTSLNSTPQPPLASELSAGGVTPAIGSCGYLGGMIPPGVTLGPYQYYSYQIVNRVAVPDGKPISFTGSVAFSRSAVGCPDPLNTGTVISTNPNGVSQSSSQFPTYIFYGGMNAGSSTLTMGAGQYVMAGTNTQVNVNGGNKNVDVVFQESGATITGDQNTGTMWVFTDAAYPGMDTQLANIPGNITAIQNLTQGSMYFKDGSFDLQGLIGSTNQGSNLPAGLNSYSGIAWWQDRRNSDVGYNKNYVSGNGCASASDCTGDDGTVTYCATGGSCTNPDSTKLANMLQANHVTATSPGVVMDPGNANIALNGVFYQPRGAWLNFVAGNAGFTCTQAQGGGPNQQCPLQVITGALLLKNGTVSLNLAGPTDPIITYKPVLIH